MRVDDGQAVAIVGVAGRFPGADNTDRLWDMIVECRTAIRRLSADELSAAGVPAEIAADLTFVPTGADVADIDAFDAEFFGITAEEARLTDPQHRLFLESAWAALEDAGTTPTDHGGRVGVFGATGWSTYLLHNIAHSAEFGRLTTAKSTMIANDKDFLCTRVSYRLNLRGPSFTVQSACSSSLLAVHLAGRALAVGECDVAIAGGVHLTVPQTGGYRYAEDSTYSRDGRCRPFDRDAAGTVMANGCAVVVLKRLADALADRDHVYAVIAASACANDGSAKIGYVAPSVSGQSEAMRAALTAAGIGACDVGYVEAHGTGTVLGDSLEVRALRAVYGAGRDGGRPCLIGSLKANIGHLGIASGVAGLVKVAMLLERGVIPGQAGFTQPHPQLGLDGSGLAVPTRAEQASGLRAVGITSTGGGGTNVHCVLTPPPEAEHRTRPEGPYLIGVSARSEAALRESVANLCGRLRDGPPVRLDDLSFTLATGRVSMAHRWAATASSVEQIQAAVSRYPAVGDPLAEAWVADPTTPLTGLGDAHKVSLPSYPFRRTRHWIDPDPRRTHRDPAVSRPGQPTQVPAAASGPRR
jgi:acyl transferase domain-containing protein